MYGVQFTAHARREQLAPVQDVVVERRRLVAQVPGIEGRDDRDRYFNYLSPEQAEVFYRTAGDWQSLELTQGEGPGYKGRRSPWVNVIARKAD